MKSTILNLIFAVGTVFGIPLAIAEYNLQKNFATKPMLDSSKIATVSPICKKIDSIELIKKRVNETLESRLEDNYTILKNSKSELAYVSLSLDSFVVGGDVENNSIDTISVIK